MPSRLINELQRRYFAQTNGGQLLAVVLHGCAVSMRQDALSDLDLLLITDQTASAFHALWYVEETPCDLHVQRRGARREDPGPKTLQHEIFCF